MDLPEDFQGQKIQPTNLIEFFCNEGDLRRVVKLYKKLLQM